MKIAQISDIHLLELGRPNPFSFLNKRLAGTANLVIGRAKQHSRAVFDALVRDLELEAVDHILCTGDVSNLALQSEFDYVRQRFLAIGGAEKLTLIPGNHDAYVREATDERRFERTFADWFPDPARAVGGHGYPFVKQLGEVVVVGCSSAVATPFFCSYGQLGDAQLGRLDAILREPGLESKLVFLLVHHHLHDTGKPFEPIRGLRDRLQLLERLRHSPVDYVLHGHEHEPHSWTMFTGKRPVRIQSCGTSTRLHSNPHKLAHYRLYEIEDNRVSAERQKVYSPTTGCFVPE
ncbi:MAG: metallophosphoesterase [Myxococcales bacterium]|nr:metallophosphoesterase [Myxococcales bacterium]